MMNDQDDETFAISLALYEVLLQSDSAYAFNVAVNGPEFDTFIRDLSFAELYEATEMEKFLTVAVDQKLAWTIQAAERRAELVGAEDFSIDSICIRFQNSPSRALPPLNTQADITPCRKGKIPELLAVNDSVVEDALEEEVEQENPDKSLVNSCVICFELVTFCHQSSSKKLPGKKFPNCFHCYCLDCLKTWLSVVLNDISVHFPITCAQPGCCSILKPQDCETILDDSKLKVKYFSRYAEATMPTMYCPKIVCNELVVLDGNNRIVNCACGTVLCGHCKAIEHVDTTCEQYQALPMDLRTPEDILLLQLAAAENWASCPTCKKVVEKRYSSDCNYVLCICGVGFCYVCGLAYEGSLKTQQKPHGTPPCTCSLFDPRNAEGDIIARNPRGIDYLIGNLQPPVHHRLPGIVDDYRPILIAENYKQNREFLPDWMRAPFDNSMCFYCKIYFARLVDLEQHLLNTRKHKVYICCDRIFRRKRCLDVHLAGFKHARYLRNF